MDLKTVTMGLRSSPTPSSAERQKVVTPTSTGKSEVTDQVGRNVGLLALASVLLLLGTSTQVGCPVSIAAARYFT